MRTILVPIFLFSLVLQAQLKVYDYPSTVRQSQFYEVTVKKDTISKPAFVHITEAPDGSFADHKIWITEHDRSVSFAQFDFSAGPVEVTVKKLWGDPAHDVLITPSRYGVLLKSFDGYSATFILDRPEYVSVRFVCDDNTDEFNNIKNALMIFADLPETNAPSIDAENVTVFKKDADLVNAEIIYFPPGEYNLLDHLPNGSLILHDDQSVYIAGGAYVYGMVNGAGTYNVKLYGRGVLSGFKHDFHYDGQRQLTELDPYNFRLKMHRGGNHTVEGITLLESVNHTLVVPQNSLVKDVKFIAWACNNDGLRSSDGSVIDHVFMKLSDDYFYATTKSLITRSVLWPMFNGATLQLGWGNRDHGGGARFLNNDLINPEWDWIGANTGFLASQLKPDATIENVLVEDVHIDGDINALAALDYAVVKGKNYEYSGHIRNFTFRNIIVNGKQIWWGNRGWDGYERLETQLSRDYNINPENPAQLGKSFVKGIKSEDGKISYIENITFENVKINGEWLTEENYHKYVDVDTSTTKNIKFLRSPEKTFKPRPKAKTVQQYGQEGVGANMNNEKPTTASAVGWLTESGEISFHLTVPKSGEYELRYGMVALYDDAEIQIKTSKGSTINLKLPAMRDNAYGNIKKVASKKIQLDKGQNTIHVQVVKGVVYPDVLEIVAPGQERGTAEINVFTHWHGVIRGGDSNWISEKMRTTVTKKELQLDLPSTIAENVTVSVFNAQGSEKLKGDRLELDITSLEDGPHLVSLTDGATFWIAKTFIK